MIQEKNLGLFVVEENLYESFNLSGCTTTLTEIEIKLTPMEIATDAGVSIMPITTR